MPVIDCMCCSLLEVDGLDSITTKTGELDVASEVLLENVAAAEGNQVIMALRSRGLGGSLDDFIR